MTVDADRRTEMSDTRPEVGGQKPPGTGMGASNITATRDNACHEAASLMRAVVERSNMQRAYARVVKNKGVAGVDDMSVTDLKDYLKAHWPDIKEQLLHGSYQPQPVLRVEIPKENGGGMRMLGIPTVVDRLVQQAIHQVLGPIFEEQFSESSYGFRPGRSTHQAILAAKQFMAKGNRWVVDMDLEKFFDRVNHDILMARVARTVKDKLLLGLIRRYLQAGMMSDGIVSARAEGTPQGGPLSPLLSNILLTDLDRELEQRGHRFCRYADDCNVYVKSARAGARVLESMTRFLACRLKLKVNADKSAVDRPWRRKFLGYSVTHHKVPRLKVAAQSVLRFKGKLRNLFRQGRGRNLQRFIEEMTPVLRGWANYYRLAEVKNIFEELDGWIRRKLRVIIWRQWKHPGTREKAMRKRGLPPKQAWKSAWNGRGPWWNAGAPHMNLAFPKSFFDQMGLLSLLAQLRKLQATT
jgi:RNA-directed DNA polymerase